MSETYVPSVRRCPANPYASFSKVLTEKVKSLPVREVQIYARLRQFSGMSPRWAYSLATSRRRVMEDVEPWVEIDVTWDYDDVPCDCDNHDDDVDTCDDVSYVFKVEARFTDERAEALAATYGFASISTSLAKDDDVEDYIWSTLLDCETHARAIEDLAETEETIWAWMEERAALLAAGAPEEWVEVYMQPLVPELAEA